jgi:hypothetical protein
MRYQDFEIRIRSGRQGGLIAEARSSYGEAAEPFVPPFPPPSIENLLTGGIRHVTSEEELVTSATPEEIGHALFAALFVGKIGDRLRECLASLDRRRNATGLRLLLHFDLADRAVVPISAFAWELLYDRERRDFLSRVLHTPVLRYIPTPRPPLEPFAGPLRILVVHAAPIGLDRLNLTEEWRRIWAALGDQPGIEVALFEHLTLSELRRKLRSETWHVLHFMGHGDFEDSGQGCVYFEDPDHRPDRITGMLLGEHLKSLPDLRLVFLNACSSGAVARRDGQDPYSAVASALLLAGIPSALAMQFPISDKAAIAFSAELYGRIAAHDPLEAALAEARLAILRLDETALEWATPVLFTRVSSDDLLGTASPPAETWQETPLRLGIRSFADSGNTILFGQEMESECDEMLDLRDLFGGIDGRSILHAVWWQTRVVPRLREFLAAAVKAQRPLHLSFAAHASIAFAAGYFLESKSGLDITIRQRDRTGRSRNWRGLDGSTTESSLFLEEPDQQRDAGVSDVAVALGASFPIQDDVAEYLLRERLPVGRIFPAMLSPEGVRDGRHALQLAQALAWTIRGRTVFEREGVLHLFAAAPNALLFFLGQLRRFYGRVQLYEHDDNSPLPGAYGPSIFLPPSAPTSSPTQERRASACR